MQIISYNLKYWQQSFRISLYFLLRVSSSFTLFRTTSSTLTTSTLTLSQTARKFVFNLCPLEITFIVVNFFFKYDSRPYFDLPMQHCPQLPSSQIDWHHEFARNHKLKSPSYVLLQQLFFVYSFLGKLTIFCNLWFS